MKRDLIENLIHKYERYVAPFTFIGGFLLDTLTLKRLDLWFDHIILVGLLLISGLSILALNAYEAGRIRLRHFEVVIPLLPVFMQFGFGGLFSAFVIFYTKSGATVSSALFLLVLIVLLVGNERFRKQYQRLVFHLSIYFVAVFSYSIFLMPIILKKMGALIFLVSGVVSLGLIALFIFILSLSLSKQIKASRRSLMMSIGGIFIVFNIFYFTNIIPPIPLSLKEIGVYHLVQKTQSGDYKVRYEKAPWFLPLQNTSSTYHWKRGEAVYVYSSIFAPTKLSIPVFHQWSQFDEKQGKWIKMESIEFSIHGGRDGGYRGYSYKTVLGPGKWRVDVVTDRGQVIGRENFTIVETNIELVLKTSLY